MIRGFVLIAVFTLLIAFAVGGVMWFFIQEYLQTKRYIEFMNDLHLKVCSIKEENQ